jgi:all-trans-retinol dehydrogenase (NAD+)
MILEQVKGEVNVTIFKCDVSEKDSVTAAANIARQAFGEVTILINNAGIVSGKSVLDNSDFMIKKTLEVNTLSHLYTIREFLPDMLRLKKGHIVSIASVAGITGSPGLCDYSASKAGAIAIDDSLRTELKKQGHYKYIKTTCINPFFINTGMFDGVDDKWKLFPILD